MKNILITIFILFAFLQGSVNAQRRTEKVNTGYVFVNGKYISAPYNIVLKHSKLYINKEFFLKTPEAKTLPKRKPKLPENIDKYDDFNKILKLKNSKTGNNYIWDVHFYFFAKYPMEKAHIMCIDYLMKIPNMKKYDTENRKLYLENGEILTFSLGKKVMWTSKVYLTKDNYKQRVINLSYLNRICSPLEMGKTVVSSTNNNLYHVFESEIMKKLLIDLNSMKPNDNIESLLKKYNIPKEKKILISLLRNNIGHNLEAFNGDKRASNNCKSNYSPYGSNIVIACPYTYDGAFVNVQQEIDEVTSCLFEYYIDYGSPSVYTDDNFDDTPGQLSYNTVKELGKNKIIYWTSHGSDWGVELMIMTSLESLRNWYMNDSYIVIDSFPLSKGNMGYSATALPEWFSNNWKTDISNNKSILFLTTCLSSLSGCAQACSGTGGAVFGYGDETSTVNNKKNTRRILQNMTGVLNQGRYRTAYEAYENINHLDDFTLHPSNAAITLCPSIENKYPPNILDQPVQTVGTGYIKFDTWCDASIELNPNNSQSPIYFATTPPGTVDFNIEWDEIEAGKSKRINYSWSSLNEDIDIDVTVFVNTDKIRSWTAGNGEGHRLDFDSIAPNGESNTFYTFTISPDENLNPNFQAESQQVQAGEDVTFINMSSGSVESQEWHFEGGTPSISYEDNPIVVYNSPGTYDVSLTVSDRYSTLTETKENYITVTENTSDYYTVSGYVEDALFYNIPGATILAESSTGVIADNDTSNDSGAYELHLPAHWTGTLRASKDTYQTDDIEIEDLSSNLENQNFTLSRNQASENAEIIYYKQGAYGNYTPENLYTYESVLFSTNPEYSTAFYDYNWDFGDFASNQNSSTSAIPTHSYTEEGDYTIRLELRDKDDGALVNISPLEIHINYRDAIHYTPMFSQSCYVVDEGTTVNFHDESIHTEGERYWDWSFGEGETSDYTCMYKTIGGYLSLYQRIVYHTFNESGSYDIKLIGYQKKTSGLPWVYDRKCNDTKFYVLETAWGKVNVVDCDYNSQFMVQGPFALFSGAIMDTWSYENWGGPKYLYGGNFLISGNSQEYLTQTDMVVRACNEIVIDGSTEFIADGTTELVLESGVIPDCQEDLYILNEAAFVEEGKSTELEIDEITCSPNPFNEYLNISIKVYEPQDIILSLCDAMGKIIIQENVFIRNTQSVTIQTKSLSPGVYFLKHNVSRQDNMKLIKTMF